MIAGYQAIRNINVRQYPRSDLSVITVTTVYYGADADLVRGFLTTPLEQSIASADGIDYMESQSQQGTSTTLVIIPGRQFAVAALANMDEVETSKVVYGILDEFNMPRPTPAKK